MSTLGESTSKSERTLDFLLQGFSEANRVIKLQVCA